MNENWIGKAISIKCIDDLGIFQGYIKDANSSKIVIHKAFRNGLPLKTLDTEVTIMAADIVKISLVPDLNTHNSMLTASDGEDNPSRDDKRFTKANNKSPPNNQKKATAKSPMNIKNAFGQFVPAKVEVKMNANTANSNGNASNNGNAKISVLQRNASVPLDIAMQSGFGKSNSASVQTSNKIDKKKTNQLKKNQSTFGTPVDDPVMDEEFDFEKNLALFNKQAIWDKIDANLKPDVVRQTGHVNKKNYRHDENILTAKPAGYRQIKTNYVSAQEYVTDDGIVIPTVTSTLRTRIQLQAEICGFTWERQCELLGRCTAEMAIQLLGGARRLSLQNQHQWPKVAIICDELLNRRHTDIGFATGRQLASQGLKVFIYTKTSVSHPSQSYQEAELFKATGNILNASIDELPSCDLIILSVQKDVDQSVIKWINDSRSPIMAIDPPASGISNINMKWSILPVLPLEDISSSCGKIYLSNLTIPDKFFYEAGVNYKSPFGHKFLIPIHLLNENGNNGNNSNDNE